MLFQNGDVLELVAYKSFSVTDAVVGIQSAGSIISSSAANLNFIGTGNTFAVNASTNTIDISISSMLHHQWLSQPDLKMSFFNLLHLTEH